MVDSLKESGEYENTVFVFTTDNGGSVSHAASNLPLRGTKVGRGGGSRYQQSSIKGTLWEGGTRGPAFVHSALLAEGVAGTTHEGKLP